MRTVAYAKRDNLWRLVRVSYLIMCLIFSGCAGDQIRAELDLIDRPVVAILPIGFEIEITHLASIKTVADTLSPEEESQQLKEALQHIRDEARWLLQSRLAAGQRVRFVPDEQVVATVNELGLALGSMPTDEQLALFRTRAGADLVLVVNIQDYGKVRWAWAAAGMFADMTAESIVIGLASAWNPTIIFANIGFELLTSTPVWFGGAYVFGVAFRPVRVEARAIETRQGIPVWQETEVAMYAWGMLEQLPEAERDKKESQLRINLETAMTGLADSLTDEGLTTRQLRAHYGQ